MTGANRTIIPAVVILAAVGCVKDGQQCSVYTRPGDAAVVISCGGDEVGVVKQGPAGTDGASCSVSNDALGNKKIVCTDGTTTTLFDGEDGTDGAGCTVADNGDETKTISCTDGTEVLVFNGQPGKRGEDGYPTLATGTPILTSVCPGGGTVLRIGSDDGDGDGDAGDGVLHPDEVDHQFTVWSGACQVSKILRGVAALDTWSWGLLPTADLSESEELCVGSKPKEGGTMSQSHAWLLLDIDDAPDEFETATLELAITEGGLPAGADGSIDVHAIAEPWTEGALDWLNEPAYTSPAVSSTPVGLIAATDAYHWIGFDVTELVQEWLDDPLTNQGIVLRSDSAAYACFVSNDTALPPTVEPRLVFTAKVDPFLQE